MNTNSASKKAISMVCLIAGIILLAASLIQDISGSGAGWRGPALIIGAPVGFVNVVEAKELIMTAGVPYIVPKGRKGGSNIAATICNAMLYYKG